MTCTVTSSVQASSVCGVTVSGTVQYNSTVKHRLPD